MDMTITTWEEDKWMQVRNFNNVSPAQNKKNLETVMWGW